MNIFLGLFRGFNCIIERDVDKFWYNGQFYSGSLNPEILFIGYNPGYGRSEWPKREFDYSKLQKSYKEETIKYIEGKAENEKLANEIYFSLAAGFKLQDNEIDKLLYENTAETNFIHFNTPDVKEFNRLVAGLPYEIQQKIDAHFHNSFQKLLHHIQPKLIVIVGISTFDNLKRKLPFKPIEILEKTANGNVISAKTKLLSPYNIQVLVTKHLSSAINDSHRGSIGAYIAQMLNDDSKI